MNAFVMNPRREKEYISKSIKPCMWSYPRATAAILELIVDAFPFEMFCGAATPHKSVGRLKCQHAMQETSRHMIGMYCLLYEEIKEAYGRHFALFEAATKSRKTIPAPSENVT